MSRGVKDLIGGILIGLFAFLIIGSFVGWQVWRHRRILQEPSQAPIVSVVEHEKKEAPPPPVEEKLAEKKPAQKKPLKLPPNAPRALASEPREWEQWGAVPYATSQEEACRKAPEAIDGFALPAPVKEQFKKLLGANCANGTDAWLTPGMPLEQMWSGKSGKKPPHVMNKVTVAELPVLQSPDGRLYRKGAVAETARALAWRVEHDGRAYVLYLPFVCFNWAWKFGVPPLPPTPPPHPPAPRPVPIPIPPPPVQEECATVEYVVVPGDLVRFGMFAQKRLPASACWRLCDGNDCAAPPSPCDTCDWFGPMSLMPEGFEPLHTGMYVAQSAKQSLRLPREARANFIALCVEREGLGGSNSWIIDPDAWRAFGKKKGVDTVISVPYAGIMWPVWGLEVLVH